MILAAGKGTRMGKASLIKSKLLYVVNGKTLIEYNIEPLKKQG